MIKERSERMDEYINRERLIKDFQTYGAVSVYGQDAIKAIISRINAQPTFNIVLCKDCKFANKHYELDNLVDGVFHYNGIEVFTHITCKHHKGKLAENDFCSYGEMKEGEPSKVEHDSLCETETYKSL